MYSTKPEGENWQLHQCILISMFLILHLFQPNSQQRMICNYDRRMALGDQEIDLQLVSYMSHPLLYMLYGIEVNYRLISPCHVPSLSPRVFTTCCHRSPPRSFVRRYFNNFCLLCTITLRFLLLTLSFLPTLVSS